MEKRKWKKFRKKPVVIEAVQWTENNIEEIEEFMGEKIVIESELVGDSEQDNLIIPTLEGEHKAIPTDWIIKGIKNEFYPCKLDIFEATYEEVNEE